MGGLKPREQAFLQALAVRRRRFAADAGARPRPGIPSQQRKVMTEQEMISRSPRTAQSQTWIHTSTRIYSNSTTQKHARMKATRRKIIAAKNVLLEKSKLSEGVQSIKNKSTQYLTNYFSK